MARVVISCSETLWGFMRPSQSYFRLLSHPGLTKNGIFLQNTHLDFPFIFCEFIIFIFPVWPILLALSSLWQSFSAIHYNFMWLSPSFSRKLSLPGVNFIKILRSIFCTKVFCAIFLLLQFGFEFFG